MVCLWSARMGGTHSDKATTLVASSGSSDMGFDCSPDGVLWAVFIHYLEPSFSSSASEVMKVPGPVAHLLVEQVQARVLWEPGDILDPQSRLCYFSHFLPSECDVCDSSCAESSCSP